MARMKFLCDADRCIDCNACVTACKNENEVPWGINRRRVVTINDGKPGERSVSMACMHCTDAPCAAVCPVSCIFPTEEGVVLHSKDLCIGCGYCFYACPFGAPQYPRVGNFGSRGKMDKCTFCAGGGGEEETGSIEEFNKYGANRLAQGKLPLCAEMCSTKSLLAGDGEIISQIYRERVLKRGYGSGAWGWMTAYHEEIPGVTGHAGIKFIMALRASLLGAAALLLLTMLFVGLPAAALQPNSGQPVDPDASAVKEQSLLDQAPRIEGRIDIPDKRASVLMQPAGRRWDYFHEVILHWLGAIVILGMIVLLALAYLITGRMRIPGGRSGKKVVRFTPFERFSHWLTAVSFVLLGLTGLNITFGKLIVRPIIGPEAFSNFAQTAKYVHNFGSFSFVVGLVLIVALWIKDNIPRQVDIAWIRQGGGFIKSKHAPAGRFNAGEKMVFWFALVAGTAVIVSGFMLLFPFYLADIAGMQYAQIVHSIVAVLFVAVILAHAYIGTLGMEGAFEAMGNGEVDLNWAKEHHDQWLINASPEHSASTPEPPMSGAATK